MVRLFLCVLKTITQTKWQPLKRENRWYMSNSDFKAFFFQIMNAVMLKSPSHCKLDNKCMQPPTVTVIIVTASLIIKRFVHRYNFGHAWQGSLQHFISVTSIVINNVTHYSSHHIQLYFYRYIYLRILTVTLTKLS